MSDYGSDYDPNSGLSTGKAAALLALCALLAGGLLVAWFLTDTQSSETVHDANGKALIIRPGRFIDKQDDDHPRPKPADPSIANADRPHDHPAATRPASRPTTAPIDEESLSDLLHPPASRPATTRPTATDTPGPPPTTDH